MENLLQPILAEIDPVVIYAIVAMLAVLLVITIIKKAIKLALFVTVFCGCMCLLGPMAKDFQENYKFNIEDGKAVITAEGKEYIVDNPADIKLVTLMYNGKQGIDVKIEYKTGILSVEVPAFMGEGIKNYLEEYEVNYKVQ